MSVSEIKSVLTLESVMALGKVKTEMRGTGGGRWMPRADAKRISKKKRRMTDKKAVKMSEVQTKSSHNSFHHD